MKSLMLLISLFLFSISLSAQTASITTTACPGAGCVDTSVAGANTIAIQITGTWSGTITFQGSINGTFVSLATQSVAVLDGTKATTTTGNGIFQANCAGLSTVRVVFTSFSSGTAVVDTRIK